MAEKTTEKTTPVKINYDWWDTDGERHSAGTVVEMPISIAKAMMAAGKAERVDPLPGE